MNEHANASTIAAQLETLYGGLTEGWLSIFAEMPDKRAHRTEWAPVSDLVGAADTMAQLSNDGYNVWYAQGIQRERLTGQQRGKEEGVIALPGLWFDLDIAGPTHKCTALPADSKGARNFLQSAIPLPPSRVIFSGGGVYPFWLFGEPLTIESEDERQAVQSASRRWHQKIVAAGTKHGYRFDSTPDLCRLLRAPGTFNRKPELSRPMLVRLIGDTPARYTLEQIDEILPLDDGSFQPASPIEGLILWGERNKTLASLAGSMRQRGMSNQAIEAALLIENQTRCDPPLAPREVADIARSISRYPPGAHSFHSRHPLGYEKNEKKAGTVTVLPSGARFTHGARHVR
jgi:Primase C terminal 1 (PriCT-1)